MFCPKCGSLLEDEAKFCTNCGESTGVTEQPAADPAIEEESQNVLDPEVPAADPAPVPKKPRKPLPAWVMPVALAGAALVIALVVFFIIVSSPKTTVKAALGGFDDAIMDNELIEALFDTAEEFYMFADIQQIYGPAGEEGLTDPMKFDIYSNGTQGSFFVDFMGTKFDAHGLTDPMALVVNSEAGAYGVVFEGLKEAFRNSVFHPDSGSKYALEMDEEALEAFEEFLDSYEKTLTEDTAEELNEYLSDYGELIIDLMWEYGEVESETKDGNKVVSVEVDEKALAKIMKDFIKELCGDEDLIAYLDENIPLTSLSLYVPSTMESWKDAMEMLEDGSEEVIDEIKSADFKLALTVTASPVAHNLKAVEVKFTVDGASVKAGIAFDGNNITLTAGGAGSKFTMALEETDEGWTVYAKVAGEKMFEAEYKESDEGWTFLVETMGQTLFEAELEKKDDNYAFDFAIYDTDDYGYDLYDDSSESVAPVVAFTAQGKYTEENGGFSFTVEELSVAQDGETTTVTMDARFGYFTEFDMPAVPEYKDLLKADEETIDELVATLTAFFESAFGNMGEAAPDGFDF